MNYFFNVLRSVLIDSGVVYLYTFKGFRFCCHIGIIFLAFHIGQVLRPGIRILQVGNRIIDVIFINQIIGSAGLDSLRFSCFLMRCPEEAVDLVVVHELCHLLERGHGPRFQALMDHFMPDWKTRRAKLR